MTTPRRPPYRLAAALVAVVVVLVSVNLVSTWPKAVAAVRSIGRWGR